MAAIAFLLLGALIGWSAWGLTSEVWPLSILILLPIAWRFAISRWFASLLILGYYMAGARGLPGGAAVFFGDGSPGWYGWACWLSACLVLTLPFALLWSKSGGGWRFVAATLASVIPPIGLVGWINPLSMAGMLFPGLGWTGLLLTLSTMMLLASRQYRLLPVLLLASISVAANVVSHPASVPDGWRGVDTHFSRLGSGESNDAGAVLAAMQRAEWVRKFAETVPENSVYMLPETVVGPVRLAAKYLLTDADARLAAKGSRLLVGAEIPGADGNKYLNAMIVLGAGNDTRQAVQSIPVPVSMWKPFSDDGAIADVWGDGGIIEVKGHRAGVLICYEQLLSFSILKAMTRSPDVLVAASNVWWARDTSIPAIQVQMTGVFGRLFGVGVVRAVNT